MHPAHTPLGSPVTHIPCSDLCSPALSAFCADPHPPALSSCKCGAPTRGVTHPLLASGQHSAQTPLPPGSLPWWIPDHISSCALAGPSTLSPGPVQSDFLHHPHLVVTTPAEGACASLISPGTQPDLWQAACNLSNDE